MRRLLCLLSISLLVGPLLAETYVVDGAAGDDANNGVTAPFKTIARGLRDLKPGDTLKLVKMDVPYRESIPLLKHGTPEAPITIDGGGATISGADTAPKDGWQEQNGVYVLPQAREVKFLFGPDIRYEQARSAQTLGNQEWFWEAGKLYFRPAAGKQPADYDLQMSVRISGIMTTGAGQIIVRNLTAMHFYNDGFNIHNGSAPIWFENIKGLWNGDEGFSAHENCECFVRNAEFSNNYWHGIADVTIARTYYQNIVVRNNRSKGIYLIGGTHGITDSVVSGSPDQIVLSPSDGTNVPALAADPMRVSTTNLRNVLVQSAAGETGLIVNGSAQAAIEHCLILGGQTGLRVDPTGRAHVLNTIIAGQAGANVVAAGDFAADYNLYFPGLLTAAGKAYTAEQFADYQAATHGDQHSFVEEPRFIADTRLVSRASRASGSAFGPTAFGGPDIGLELRAPKPEEPGVQPPQPLPTPPSKPAPAAVAAAPAGAAVVLPELPAPGEGPAPAADKIAPVKRLTHLWEFEQTNPWNRAYPEPVKTPAGQPLKGVLELSTEQVHNGQKALKLAVQAPEAPPASVRVKLFSGKLNLDKPIRVVRFWMYGDASGRQFNLRVRDAQGESFYDATRKMDWTGWQQITWDLAQRPPVNVVGGNKNLIQDGPPLELVMDLTYPTTDRTPAVIYIDDLELEIEG
ncbi:MAG: right-handed parallel beta-helix repeat-containing protein [Armatimonadia bacterium]